MLVHELELAAKVDAKVASHRYRTHVGRWRTADAAHNWQGDSGSPILSRRRCAAKSLFDCTLAAVPNGNHSLTLQGSLNVDERLHAHHHSGPDLSVILVLHAQASRTEVIQVEESTRRNKANQSAHPDKSEPFAQTPLHRRYHSQKQNGQWSEFLAAKANGAG